MTSPKTPALEDIPSRQTTFRATVSECEDGRWRVLCDEYDAESGHYVRRVMDDNFGTRESARGAAMRLAVFMRYEGVEWT